MGHYRDSVPTAEVTLNLSPASLLSAPIARFNPQLKQAMYAAANRGIIRRGTWDGCAFNQAGVEVGDSGISSVTLAAKRFGLPARTVAFFINTWDRLTGTDEEATEALKEAILRAGLFSEPTTAIAVIRHRTYEAMKSEQDKFEAVIEDLDFESEAEIQSAMSILTTPFNEEVAALL